MLNNIKIIYVINLFISCEINMENGLLYKIQ